MSSHKTIYRIYPDDRAWATPRKTHEEWQRASKYINGMANSFDKKEAFAIAKKAALNSLYPFVVMAIPLPNRKKACDYWVFV